jgi:hypothetical protein
MKRALQGTQKSTLADHLLAELCLDDVQPCVVHISQDPIKTPQYSTDNSPFKRNQTAKKNTFSGFSLFRETEEQTSDVSSDVSSDV